MSLVEEIQMEERPINIEKRFETIQKELNDWKRYTCWLIAFVVLIILGSLFYGCMLGKNKISAHRFTLVDELGKPRAALGMASGHPALIFFDAQGLSCAALGVHPDGKTSVVMGGGKGQGAAFSISVDLDGTPSLAMFDSQGKTRLGFGVNQDGFPVLDMRDVQGKNRLVLGLDLGMMPLIALYDAQGNHRVSFGVNNDGTPELWMSNAQGKTIWSAP